MSSPKTRDRKSRWNIATWIMITQVATVCGELWLNLHARSDLVWLDIVHNASELGIPLLLALTAWDGGRGLHHRSRRPGRRERIERRRGWLDSHREQVERTAQLAIGALLIILGIVFALRLAADGRVPGSADGAAAGAIGCVGGGVTCVLVLVLMSRERKEGEPTSTFIYATLWHYLLDSALSSGPMIDYAATSAGHLDLGRQVGVAMACLVAAMGGHLMPRRHEHH